MSSIKIKFTGAHGACVFDELFTYKLNYRQPYFQVKWHYYQSLCLDFHALQGECILVDATGAQYDLSHCGINYVTQADCTLENKCLNFC